MPHKKIPVGKRYGMLTIIDNLRDEANHTIVVCRCDCGSVIIRNAAQVRSRKHTSCGCLVGRHLIRKLPSDGPGSL